MKKFAGIISTITVAALAAACGAVSNGGGATPTPADSATPTPTSQQATTLADVNLGNVAPNTSVTLDHLVVTAVTSQGDFFAQDAGGGLNSGCYFFDKNHHSPVDLAIGDEVSVTGTFSPYQGPTSSPWGAAENEIVPATVTQTGSGLTPVAIEIPAAELQADLKVTNKIPDHPEYMGALVHVTGAQVTGLTAGFGEYTVGGTTSGKIKVDHSIYDSYEPRLVTEVLGDLTGVVAYDFNDYHINPRQASDITTTSTNVVTDFASLKALTTNSTVKSGQLVNITSNIFVSGTAPYTSASSGNSLRSFWAQDSAVSTTNGGMYFDDGRYSNPALDVGTTITSIKGKYIVTGTNFKIHSIAIGFADTTTTISNAAPVTLTPATVTLAALKANVSKYEGVLVKVADSGMTVTTATNSYNEFEFGAGANKFWVSPLGFDPGTRAAASAIASVKGPMYFAHGNDYLVPQVAADIQ